MNVIYQIENSLTTADFSDILNRSTLAERRPSTDWQRLEKMCANANLIITARLDGKIVGVARSLTDFAFCTYLSDLAVDQACQHQGIGKRLIEETKAAAPDAMLILLAAPAAVGYYPKVGMTKFEHCYILK